MSTLEIVLGGIILFTAGLTFGLLIDRGVIRRLVDLLEAFVWRRL